MDDFEKAAVCTCDCNVGDDVRRQAVTYIESVRDHPDGWRFCLERFFNPSACTRDDVRFICLQVIHHAVATRRPLSADDTETLRKALISWPTSVLPSNPTSPPVRNKFAQVLVAFMKYRAPLEWVGLFEVLMGSATGSEVALDFLLRVLLIFSEEIVDRSLASAEDQAIANAVKDELRKGTVGQLAQMWLAVMTTFADTRPALVTATLKVLRGFTSWIPIGLVANDQFIPLLFRFLTNPTYVEDSCECVSEILGKGMDAAPKVAMIRQLRLPNAAAVMAQSPDTNLALKMAKLLTEASFELLLACEKLQATDLETARTAAAMVDEMVPFLVSYLGNEDNEVSEVTYAFFHPFVTRFRGSSLRGVDCRAEHVQLLLPVLLRKIAYPEDFFDTKKAGDEEEEFNEFRKKIGNIFKALVKLSPEIVLTFVHASLQSVCQPQPPSDFVTAEAALYLFYIVGEGIGNMPTSPTQQAAAADPNRGASVSAHATPIPSPIPSALEGPIQEMLRVVINSGISYHQHHTVVLTYFEIVVRYMKNVVAGDPAFAVAMTSFLDTRGIRHRLPVVRRRATYLFQRFIKALRTQMQQHIPAILESVKDVIAIDPEVQQMFPFDDQLSLYESFGQIIGSKPPDQASYVECLLRPLLCRLTDILDSKRYTADTPEKPWFVTLLKQHLNAITVFSKGFGYLDKDPAGGAVAQPFMEAMKEAMRTLQAFPTEPTVWTHVATYVHRMVDTLGTIVLPYVGQSLEQLSLSLEALGASCTPGPTQQAFFKELSDHLSLLGQVSSKYKEQSCAPLGKSLAGAIALCARVLGPSLAQCTQRSEEARELIELHKQILNCLWSITTNSPQVLSCPEVAPQIGGLFTLLNQGFATSADPSHQRLVARFYSRMVVLWCVQSRVQGFDEYISNTVIPMLVGHIVGGGVNVLDAATHQFIQEVAAILLGCHKVFGAQSFQDYIAQIVLAPMGCPQHLIAAMVTTLSVGNGDALVGALKSIARPSPKS